jgi:hypothetical protein
MMIAVVAFTTHPHTSRRATHIARRTKLTAVLLRTAEASVRMVPTKLLTAAVHAHATTVVAALRLTEALLAESLLAEALLLVLLLLLLRRRPGHGQWKWKIVSDESMHTYSVDHTSYRHDEAPFPQSCE